MDLPWSAWAQENPDYHAARTTAMGGGRVRSFREVADDQIRTCDDLIKSVAGLAAEVADAAAKVDFPKRRQVSHADSAPFDNLPYCPRWLADVSCTPKRLSA